MLVQSRPGIGAGSIGSINLILILFIRLFHGLKTIDVESRSAMNADNRSLSVQTDVNRWDILWINLYAYRFQIFSLIICSLAFHSIATFSYLLVVPPEIGKFMVDFGYFKSAAVFFSFYVVFALGCGAYVARKATEARGVLGKHTYVCSEGGFAEKTAVNDVFESWGILNAVSLKGNNLFVVLSTRLVYVIRASDVDSQSAFKEFADLAVERFKQAKQAR